MNQNEQKKIISSCKWIRDLPFEAGVIGEGYFEALEYIKTYRRGSCSQKHYLLGSICEGLGLSVKYLTYPFYWRDVNVTYPNFIKELVAKMPLQYHLAIQVNIDGEEFFLDITWDSSLEKAGFHINKIGDELKNTELAVVPAGKCIMHTGALERSKYIKELIRRMPRTGIEYEFYMVLNEWLEGIRKT